MSRNRLAKKSYKINLNELLILSTAGYLGVG